MKPTKPPPRAQGANIRRGFLGYAVRREHVDPTPETFEKHSILFGHEIPLAGAKPAHVEEDYFATAYLFATSSQLTTLQSAAI